MCSHCYSVANVHFISRMPISHSGISNPHKPFTLLSVTVSLSLIITSLLLRQSALHHHFLLIYIRHLLFHFLCSLTGSQALMKPSRISLCSCTGETLRAGAIIARVWHPINVRPSMGQRVDPGCWSMTFKWISMRPWHRNHEISELPRNLRAKCATQCKKTSFASKIMGSPER